MRRPLAFVLPVLLVLALVSTADAHAKDAKHREHWVAAFAAPAQSQIPDVQPPPAAASVRSIAHLSIGGSAVRIRLSNAAPGGPDLNVHAISVAKQRVPGSPALVPGTRRTVRFNGRTD